MKASKKTIHLFNSLPLLLLIFFGKSHSAYACPLRFNGEKVCDTSQKKDGDVLSYSTIVRNKNNYSLEIKTTYIYDKAYLQNLFVADSNKIVLHQELIFRRNGTILEIKKHNFKKKAITNRKNGTLLEIVIVEVGVVYGEKGSFYAIEGSGLCNSCSVYSGFFSLTGVELYKEYTSYGNKTSLTGDFDAVMNNYGIKKNKRLRRFTNTWVFPPERSGEIIN